ncbi:MAG TPA: hypothetical protein VGS00_04310 [Thermoanaerobaculia bacterium]|nr:hypothetical protein [Thermoanaerobaculia bacterium]
MGKRIVLLPNVSRAEPPQPAADEPFERGKERRRRARRGGVPRRTQSERRGKRAESRRNASDRRRHRDRRFGLDPTLYDRLADLDL